MKKQDKEINLIDLAVDFFITSLISFIDWKNWMYGKIYIHLTMYNLKVNLLQRQIKSIEEMQKLCEEQWRIGGWMYLYV